jgi:hypothetical protein
MMDVRLMRFSFGFGHSNAPVWVLQTSHLQLNPQHGPASNAQLRRHPQHAHAGSQAIADGCLTLRLVRGLPIAFLLWCH